MAPGNPFTPQSIDHTHGDMFQSDGGAPLVQIYISCVDCIVTLYHLIRPSGRPPDYTAYLTHKGRQMDM